MTETHEPKKLKIKDLRSFQKASGHTAALGLVLFSWRWPSVPPGEKNGSAEDGKKASRAPKDTEQLCW